MDLDPEVSALIDVAILMAQELQEFVDAAVESSGDGDALESTQVLLEEWETAFKQANIGPSWVDHMAQNGDAGDLDNIDWGDQ